MVLPATHAKPEDRQAGREGRRVGSAVPAVMDGELAAREEPLMGQVVAKVDARGGVGVELLVVRLGGREERGGEVGPAREDDAALAALCAARGEAQGLEEVDSRRRRSEGWTA
eukprot:2571531-Pleurochrysis_carterae.AAC.1